MRSAPEIRDRLVRLLLEVFLRDPARPVEWISLGMLYGWAQFLLTRPEEFMQPRYIAFHALPANWWATIIIVVIAAQLIAMWPSRISGLTRFVGMALASGLWTVIAIALWTSVDQTPVSARTTTVLPIATIVVGIYLGAIRQRA